jgi:uncharacterized membrane protein
VARRAVSNWSGSKWRLERYDDRERSIGPLGFAIVCWAFLWGWFAAFGAGYSYLWMTLWIAVAFAALVILLLLWSRWINRGGPAEVHERKRQRDIRRHREGWGP